MGAWGRAALRSDIDRQPRIGRVRRRPCPARRLPARAWRRRAGPCAGDLQRAASSSLAGRAALAMRSSPPHPKPRTARPIPSTAGRDASSTALPRGSEPCRSIRSASRLSCPSSAGQRAPSRSPHRRSASSSIRAGASGIPIAARSPSLIGLTRLRSRPRHPLASPAKSRPCLSACPVGAFTDAGYDVEACARHLHAPAGCECRDRGCLARRACPVGTEHAYGPAQSAFHMAAFMAAHP